MVKRHITLPELDKTYLKGLLSKGNLSVKVYKRATALLGLDAGKSYVELGKLLGVKYNTVSIWSKRYKELGLSMLRDAPRSGRPVEITGKTRAQITALACSNPPLGYGKWSLRLLSDKVVELGYVSEISHTAVGKILKKTSCSRTLSDNGV